MRGAPTRRLVEQPGGQRGGAGGNLTGGSVVGRRCAKASGVLPYAYSERGSVNAELGAVSQTVQLSPEHAERLRAMARANQLTEDQVVGKALEILFSLAD